MLRFSFGQEAAAAAIEKAVRQAIDDGFRTRDIGSEGPGIQLVGTAAMGAAVLARL
jgi:3-isopropylmalate dehydrogenase